MAKITEATAERLFMRHFMRNTPAQRAGTIKALQLLDMGVSTTEEEQGVLLPIDADEISAE